MQENNSENATANRTYSITIYGFDSGLNEVFNGVYFDYQQKRIVNPVKKKNDETMIKQLRFRSDLREIKTPIVIHYAFYVKDKRRDRMNIASAADKSFEDALQKVGFIKNDGFNDVLNATFEFHVDKDNPRIEIKITEVEREDGRLDKVKPPNN